MSNIRLQVMIASGTSIFNACKEAIELAYRLRITIIFDFNGIEMRADGNSNIDKMVERYRTKCAQTVN